MDIHRYSPSASGRLNELMNKAGPPIRVLNHTGPKAIDDQFGDELKVTGQPLTQHPSGSVRDGRVGKGRYDLLSPAALRRVAIVSEKGAVKYSPRNWEKGQPLAGYYESAFRHMTQWMAGDRDEDHLGHAVWNLMSLIHTEEETIKGKLDPHLTLKDLPESLQGLYWEMVIDNE